MECKVQARFSGLKGDKMELEILNMNQICRTCKCVASQMRPLFERYENPHQTPSIDEMLMACASVQVMYGDGLPSHICEICLEQLKNAFVFKRQAEKIDANLREHVKNIKVDEIKQELQNFDVIVPKTETDDTQDIDDDQTLLTCRECSKLFSSIHQLRRHEDSHTQKKVYVCKICNKTLAKMRYLERHLITHLKQKLYPCNTCNRVFSRVDHLHNHVPRCKRDIVHVCDICNKMFKHEDSLKVHRMMHEDQPELPTIENLDNMEEHYYEMDQDVDTVLSDYSDIDDCFEPQLENTESLNDVSDDNDHNGTLEIATNSPENEKTDQICEVKVEDPLKIEENVLDMKVEDVKLPSIRYHLGRSRKNLNAPKIKDSGRKKERSKKFACSECDQKFIRNDYLVVHMRRHRGEKPFKCKYCEKGFPRTTDLKIHERYHTGEKTHVCTICRKGFERLYNLKVHMRTHTGEKPYKCTYCDAAFAQGNGLRAHVRRHTGERFHCELCDDKFLLPYLLDQHKRTVHGLTVVRKCRRLQPIYQEENSEEAPPITVPLSETLT